MIDYNPEVVRRYAAQLYSRANGIIATWTLAGAIFGAFALGSLGAAAFAPAALILGGVGLVLGALVGLSIGRSRAFMLKLEAQLALCQVQIEFNTRTASSPSVNRI